MGGGIKGWDLGKTPAPRDFNNSIWRPQEKYRFRGDLLEKYPGVIPSIFEWCLGRPPFGQQGHPLIKIYFLGSRMSQPHIKGIGSATNRWKLDYRMLEVMVLILEGGNCPRALRPQLFVGVPG